MASGIELSRDEVEFLRVFVKKGRSSARKLCRARVLLLADQRRGDTEIAGVLDVGRNTVWRIKRRYLSEGLESALEEKPRPGQPRKYTERHKAEIIALACTTPPEGRRRWSIALLTETLGQKKGFVSINHETVRLVLKKAGLNLG